MSRVGSTACDYPLGVALAVDSDTLVLDQATLFGGSPARIMRLTPPGQAAWRELLAGPVSTPAAGRLARRLTDAGLLHPVPEPARDVDVTVIVPVRDRSDELAACLASLAGSYPVLVVDDGSLQPERVAAVCAEHGACFVPRTVNGGPAAARNTGLAAAETELVLFLDSDCLLDPSVIAQLAGHFADPMVAAVAPRVVGAGGASAIARYGAMAGPLDLGSRPGRVLRGSRISYVPTAALLVRRAALDHFDEALRYGEDVDLVWRLDAAGWRVRYDPSITVPHQEPSSWPGVLRRRFRYGTSAGPLSRRHPGALAPAVLHLWSGLAVLAALLRRPWLAAAALLASLVGLRRLLREAGLPAQGAVRSTGLAAGQSAVTLSRMAAQFGVPLCAVALRRRPFAVALLLLVAPLDRWRASGRELDPLRFSAAHLADDLAYGSGVIAGALRSRTAAPLRPILTARLLRVDARSGRPPHSAPHPVRPTQEAQLHA